MKKVLRFLAVLIGAFLLIAVILSPGEEVTNIVSGVFFAALMLKYGMTGKVFRDNDDFNKPIWKKVGNQQSNKE